MKELLKRLAYPGNLRKLFIERLTEPIHLNLYSVAIAVAGTYRAKVDADLIMRPQYAFPILYAADLAKKYGVSRLTIAELGVASGAGLHNMCRLADRTKAATGIDFRVVGFDTGQGMPPAQDYRDLPEHFQAGDFPMDFERLRRSLPSFAELVIGDIKETADAFIETVSAEAPIGFVVIDVDYYSSARSALRILTGSPERYLPLVPVFLDDIGLDGSNPWTGELLAVREFNDEQAMRKIAPFTLLRSRRIFKNPQWIDRMYACHIHDHPIRSPKLHRGERRYIPNEYVE